MTLEQLEAEVPGVEALIRALAGYFKVPLPSARSRIEGALARCARSDWVEQAQALTQIGFLPNLDVATDRQVGELWTNPLYQLVLEEGMKFSPPASTLLTEHRRPRPVTTPAELQTAATEAMADQEAGVPYWKMVFGLVFPELYLEPFLPQRSEDLVGCDLACGWGRACLNLRNWDRYRLTAVDLSDSGLNELERQAEAFGIADRVQPLKSDVLNLSVPDDAFDFLLAFDIFEHLTDPTLEALLKELLRVIKPGGILYAETPLEQVFTPITHLQGFTLASYLRAVQAVELNGLSFRPRFFHEHIPIQMTFHACWSDLVPPVVLDER